MLPRGNRRTYGKAHLLVTTRFAAAANYTYIKNACPAEGPCRAVHTRYVCRYGRETFKTGLY